MVSVIVCSRHSKINDNFADNVISTAGVPVEIIAVDNSRGDYNINEAYNKGALSAVFPYLCFIHEDVRFRSAGWGKKIVNRFEKKTEIGLLGIAGGIYKPDHITGWTTGIDSWDRANVLHANPKTQEVSAYYNNPAGLDDEDVLTLDGVLMAVKAAIFAQVQFDERLPGFHFYDIEYALRIRAAGWRTCVLLKDFDLIHYSGGKFNDAWIDAAYQYHLTNRTRLQEMGGYKGPDSRKLIIRSKIFWINRLSTEQLSWGRKMKLLINYGLVLNLRYWYRVLIFLIK